MPIESLMVGFGGLGCTALLLFLDWRNRRRDEQKKGKS